MTNSEPTAHEQYHDGNERDVDAKQSQSVVKSEAIQQDSEIDSDAVQVLPGTGGPDDVGEVELDPEDYNRDGKPSE